MSHIQIDASRLLCPMPVIKLQDKIKTLVPGDTVEVLCTDPGALHDIPAWCRVHGHDVLKTEEAAREIRITVTVRD